jgi:hypothetical protein
MVDFMDLPVFNLMLTLCRQASPCISDKDYNDFLTILCRFGTQKDMVVEDVDEEVLVLHNFHQYFWKDNELTIFCVL